jgi:hypothetical protein
MATNGKETKIDKSGCKFESVVTEDSEYVQLNGQREEDDESVALLQQPRRGGLSKKPKKPTQKVQWNDRNGNKLVEILEFQPSDDSDSEDEDLDSCICIVM